MKQQETEHEPEVLAQSLRSSAGASHRHATIKRDVEGWRISDLQSINGTNVNKDRVVEPRLLASGDTLSFAIVWARFCEDDADVDVPSEEGNLRVDVRPPAPTS